MKIPFIDKTLANQLLIPITPETIKGKIQAPSAVHTQSRSSTILEDFIDRTILVHNGRTYKLVKIYPSMVGYKLGAFLLTKKQGRSIHNSEGNRKKKEKQRRKITMKKQRKTVSGNNKAKVASKYKKPPKNK